MCLRKIWWKSTESPRCVWWTPVCICLDVMVIQICLNSLDNHGPAMRVIRSSSMHTQKQQLVSVRESRRIFWAHISDSSIKILFLFGTIETRNRKFVAARLNLNRNCQNCWRIEIIERGKWIPCGPGTFSPLCCLHSRLLLYNEVNYFI